jgi:hypothetical protein
MSENIILLFQKSFLPHLTYVSEISGVPQHTKTTWQASYQLFTNLQDIQFLYSNIYNLYKLYEYGNSFFVVSFYLLTKFSSVEHSKSFHICHLE